LISVLLVIAGAIWCAQARKRPTLYPGKAAA
jgi:hypothetical protein